MPIASRIRRSFAWVLALVLLAAMVVPALADGTPAASAADAGTALSGAVLDSDGNPVAGATIEVMRQGHGLVATAGTGSDGSYALTLGSAQGLDFRLRVWALGFATAEQTWVPMVDGGRVDFSLSGLTAALAGRVQDGNASPVAGAQVQLFRRGAGLVAAATSDADGAYRIAGVPAAGNYLAQVVLAGYSAFQQALPALAAGATLRLDPTISQATARLTGQAVDAQSGSGIALARVEVLRKGRGLVVEGSTDNSGNFSYSLPGTSAAEYQLRILARGHVAYASALFALPGGTIRDLAGSDQIALAPAFGSVAGFVFDQNGNARSGVPVHLDKLGLGTIATAATDGTGWYAISDVPVAADQSYRVRVLPQSVDGAAATDSAWFSLAGGTQYEADFSVQVMAAGTSPYGTISGRVVDDGGRPLAGVTVAAARAMQPGSFNYATTTDANGHYRLDLPANKQPFSTPPGYVVSVSAPGFFPNDQPVLTLPPSTTTTSMVAAPPAAALVDVVAYKLTTANFTLRASTGRISGRALDPQGRPVAGAAVTLWREGQGSVATANTDANGRYAFTGFAVVGRPSYVAEVHADGFTPSVLAKDGGTGSWLADAAGGLGTLQDVRLQPVNAAVAGSVVDGGGRAVAGATVTATDLVSGTTYSAITGPDGSYAITGLAAAGQSYALNAAGRHARASALAKAGDLAPPLAPNPGDRLSLDLLVVPDSATLEGTVNNADGGLVPGATVELWQEGVGLAATTTAGPAGQYSFTGLVPGGRYAVRAGKEGYFTSSLKVGLEYVPGLVSVEGGDHPIWNLLLYRQG